MLALFALLIAAMVTTMGAIVPPKGKTGKADPTAADIMYWYQLQPLQRPKKAIDLSTTDLNDFHKVIAWDADVCKRIDEGSPKPVKFPQDDDREKHRWRRICHALIGHKHFARVHGDNGMDYPLDYRQLADATNLMCRRFVSKELYLPREELDGEQLHKKWFKVCKELGLGRIP